MTGHPWDRQQEATERCPHQPDGWCDDCRSEMAPVSEPSEEAVDSAAQIIHRQASMGSGPGRHLQWHELCDDAKAHWREDAREILGVRPPVSEGATPPRIEYENNGREVWHADDRYPMKRLPEVLTIEDGSMLQLYECTHCAVRAFAGLDARRHIVVRVSEAGRREPDGLDLLRCLRALVSHTPFDHDYVADEKKCHKCKLLVEVDAVLRAAPREPDRGKPDADPAAAMGFTSGPSVPGPSGNLESFSPEAKLSPEAKDRDTERLDWLNSHTPCPEGKMITSLSRGQIDGLMRAASRSPEGAYEKSPTGEPNGRATGGADRGNCTGDQQGALGTDRNADQTRGGRTGDAGCSSGTECVGAVTDTERLDVAQELFMGYYRGALFAGLKTPGGLDSTSDLRALLDACRAQRDGIRGTG